MGAGLNTWSNVSSIARVIQEAAYFVVRENASMQGLVTVYTDMTGANLRKTYKYNQLSAVSPAETDDLTSYVLTPSIDQTFTPAEIGLQAFVNDLRRDSEAPESIIRDVSLELGYAASDKIQSDLVTDMASLTGGTIGAAGSTITWKGVSNAIQLARLVNKSNSVPLATVVHSSQWAVLAASASIAGASVAPAPGFQEEITRSGFVATFAGVPIYQVFGGTISGDDFKGGVFPKAALAIDWRRPIRIEPQRDASRRGEEFNMSGVYAHGVRRPDLGILMIFDASNPSTY